METETARILSPCVSGPFSKAGFPFQILFWEISHTHDLQPVTTSRTLWRGWLPTGRSYTSSYRWWLDGSWSLIHFGAGLSYSCQPSCRWVRLHAQVLEPRKTTKWEQEIMCANSNLTHKSSPITCPFLSPLISWSHTEAPCHGVEARKNALLEDSYPSISKSCWISQERNKLPLCYHWAHEVYLLK